MEIILKARPEARPNLWIIELADEVLRRSGNLLQIAQNYHYSLQERYQTKLNNEVC